MNIPELKEKAGMFKDPQVLMDHKKLNRIREHLPKEADDVFCLDRFLTRVAPAYDKQVIFSAFRTAARH